MEARELFKLVDPSVVVVHALTSAGAAQGSGVILAPLEVITNCHVVEGARKINVTRGNVERSAKVRFHDAARDLCELQLDDGLPDGKPILGMLPSKELEVGQPVYAIGSPRGLENTITRGIVSALREKSGEGAKLIQTDAAVSPGSSGGGLFDQDGRLIGIITFQARDSQNLNFAHLTDWIPELASRNRDRTQVVRPTLPVPRDATPTPREAAPAPHSEDMPSVGDRWSYRLSHRGRRIGTLTVQVTEIGHGKVKERFGFDSDKSFRAEREVEVTSELLRFQPVVLLPGGYQLAEIAPYWPSMGAVKTGQTWMDIPAEVGIAGIGRNSVKFTATAVGQENITVPLGKYNALRIEAQSTTISMAGTGAATRVKCIFWYSPELHRTLKMHYVVDSPVFAAQTVETYELSSFESGL
jgi:hypothetical protein